MDQRMQDGLEACARVRIGEYSVAQPRPVELAAGVHSLRSEFGHYAGKAGRTALAQRMRSEVGVRDLDAARRKGARDFRLAAADASGEADDERTHAGKKVRISVRPEKSAIAPAMAR